MVLEKTLLRVPWTARRSNQSILKEISPAYSLERLTLKLKLQPLATWCEEMTHWKRPWWWERLKAVEGDDRGWDGWMESPILWTWVCINSGSWWWGLGSLACYSPWDHKELDTTEQLNWTENFFLAVPSLRCSVLAFSSFGEQRLLCSCNDRSCRSAGALESRL